MTSNPQDRIVATITSCEGEILKIEEGKVIPAPYTEDYWEHLYITETMLLQMNSFMRKRWEKAAEDLAIRKKDYPATPDECYPSF